MRGARGRLFVGTRWLRCSPALFLLLLCSCGRLQSSVPEMPVSLERNAVTINCLYPGSSWRIESAQYTTDRIGYAGVQLVMAFDSQYYAFDLCCPNELSPTVRVGKPSDVLCCECPVCGEVYDLGYGQGSPTKGICDESLRRYSVSFAPLSQTIYIQN